MSTATVFPANLAVVSLASAADRSRLSSGDAWLMLIDVDWQGQHIRLARNVDPVTFDAGDGAGAQVYQAFNFDLEVDLPGSGQLASIALKCSNVLGLLQNAIEGYAGAVGATVNIYVVNTAHMAGEPELAMTTTILQTDVSPEQVSFKLGPPAPQKQLFPRFLYRANFCIWVTKYKGKQCGYTGALLICDGTLDGPNGCVQHANQQRFGAFPGIGTNGAAIAGQT